MKGLRLPLHLYIYAQLGNSPTIEWHSKKTETNAECADLSFMCLYYNQTQN